MDVKKLVEEALALFYDTQIGVVADINPNGADSLVCPCCRNYENQMGNWSGTHHIDSIEHEEDCELYVFYQKLKSLETSFEIEDALVQNLPSKLGGVFIQTPLEDGLKATDYQKMLRLLNSEDNELVSMRAVESEGSAAFGFGNLALMEENNLAEQDVEAFVNKIISDTALESDNGLYEIKPGFWIYIGYQGE